MSSDYPYNYERFSNFYTTHKNQIYSDFNEALNLLNQYMRIHRIGIRNELIKLSKYLREIEGWE